jgi:hypothetical protein
MTPGKIKEMTTEELLAEAARAARDRDDALVDSIDEELIRRENEGVESCTDEELIRRELGDAFVDSHPRPGRAPGRIPEMSRDGDC